MVYRLAICKALENSGGDSVGGDSEVNQLWAIITCAHGEFVHISSMQDRAERLACGHTNPRPCVVCRSEWQARSRPPHLVEMAEHLPRPRSGGGWWAEGGALQFAELLEDNPPRLVPAGYVTAGSHHTLTHITADFSTR